MNKTYLLLLIGLLLSACNAQKITVAPDPIENRQLDTLTVTAPPPSEYEVQADPAPEVFELPVYNAAYNRANDLLHTQLDLRFDWDKEQVIGKANLRLKPVFYPSQEVRLDAKGFEFKKVALAGASSDLTYEYDGQEIIIQLDRPYTREEEYELAIDYVATPSQSGGSAAITSDKGLFFINPRGEEGNKPRQIWTQGETENNSRWFPTIDKPNERCTQDLSVTIADQYLSLSNGTLVSSTKNGDGTRTDRWTMDQPHAPYLFMLAIGEFAKVEDTWNGIPVNYYVEKEFADHAKAIYPYTTDMLTFFSDLTGVAYPWPKYSQVVVRDYVSGAMENTTAVIFGEFMQGTARELIDVETNEKIVAHEMFHHWFGDLVTCESWANLTLNEGFANYSEYLWMEHKHGRDAADYHLLQEWSGYIGSSNQSGVHPLIHYGYDDKEDMFDAHSYNKGGAVLHMLRSYLGDDAFFAGFQKYLNDHAYTAVEVDELRMAFEDVTGQDLHWFFDQWFMSAGHPEIIIESDYDASSSEVVLSIKQVQDPEVNPPIFQIPVAVDVYTSASADPVRHKVMIKERDQQLRFPSATAPKLVVFDADRVLLAERENNKSPEELAFQYHNAPLFLDRYEAVQKLSSGDTPESMSVLKAALNDPFYAIRGLALQSIGVSADESIVAIIRQLAKNDPHSEVRSTAILLLAEAEDTEAVAIAKKAIEGENAYPVVGAGLQTLAVLEPAGALEVAKSLEKETNPEILAAIGTIYASSGDLAYLAYFEDHLEELDGYSAINFYDAYQSLIAQIDPTEMPAAAQKLEAIAINMAQSPWRRLAATKAISDLRNTLQEKAAEVESADELNKRVMELNLSLETIKEKEENADLKGIYRQF